MPLDPDEPPVARPSRNLAPALVALALLAAAAAFQPDGAGGGFGLNFALPDLPFSLGWPLAIFGVTVFALAVGTRIRGFRDRPPRKPRPIWIGPAILIAVVAALTFVRAVQNDPEPERVRNDRQDAEPAPVDRGGRSSSDAIAWIVAGSLVASAGALVLFAARGRGSEAVVPEDDETLIEIATNSPDPEQIADPRRSVVVAFARTWLAARDAGVDVHASDAPGEVASKLSTSTGSGTAPARLTDLYLVARFSREHVDESMRADALAAYSAISRGLAT